MQLSGLKKEAGAIYQDDNSVIFKFMSLMDNKILNRENLSKKEVSEILSFFESYPNSWTIKDANPDTIKSFSDWICALGNCLSKMCEVLSKE